MPTSDVVADLYDGFLRRSADPETGREVARDLRMRHEERLPERVAARRVGGRGALGPFLRPRGRREVAFAAVLWTIVGLELVLVYLGYMGLAGVACFSAVGAMASVCGTLLWTTGLGVSRPEQLRRCQSCNYDMAGLPAAIDPDVTEGESTGPARCPECGMRWPLVPRERPE